MKMLVTWRDGSWEQSASSSHATNASASRCVSPISRPITDSNGRASCDPLGRCCVSGSQIDGINRAGPQHLACGPMRCEVHLLEAGHFALESQEPEIAAMMRDFP